MEIPRLPISEVRWGRLLGLLDRWCVPWGADTFQIDALLDTPQSYTIERAPAAFNEWELIRRTRLPDGFCEQGIAFPSAPTEEETPYAEFFHECQWVYSFGYRREDHAEDNPPVYACHIRTDDWEQVSESLSGFITAMIGQTIIMHGTEFAAYGSLQQEAYHKLLEFHEDVVGEVIMWPGLARLLENDDLLIFAFDDQSLYFRARTEEAFERFRWTYLVFGGEPFR